ncbi:complex 1 protein (LYR family) protein [Beauveria bassiana ARSEF 2860]|uniref:Complex 1 protein (LYR family) protein n=1 Tax=Beauveria bassiana (strain ARSEF 2860) TaxID=655819 RepID=J5J9R2_BEAB2|nr:complex 1 protein (LYR family) protein [Beauveria bassiana ARSEF 2860]EJP62993.1 complex 1 protein (LYR family) protein [Beauveria bassiana ARSEF 2860]
MRLSGLQKEVLALYRHCLRESRKKPEVPAVPYPNAFNRIFKLLREFAKSRDIDKRDFAAIEFLLRKGKRQLQVYSSSGIKDIR